MLEDRERFWGAELWRLMVNWILLHSLLIINVLYHTNSVQRRFLEVRKINYVFKIRHK